MGRQLQCLSFSPDFFSFTKMRKSALRNFSKIEWEKGGGLNNTTKGKRKEFSLATSVRQQQQKQKILVVSSSSVKVLLSFLFHTCLPPPVHNIPSIFLCRSDISSLCLHTFGPSVFRRPAVAAVSEIVNEEMMGIHVCTQSRKKLFGAKGLFILEKIYVCIERYGKLARFSPKLFRSSPHSFLPAVTAKKGTVFDRWRFGWGGKGGGCLRGWKEEEAAEMKKKSEAVQENCLFKLLFLWRSLEIIVWKTKGGEFFFYILRTVGYSITSAKFTLPAFDVICSISLKNIGIPDSQLI